MSSNQQLLLGEGAGSAPAVFVEDVFSTYLYTGNGSTQTITNNIDLSTKGGMMWLARRDSAMNPRIWDTVRGRAFSVATDGTFGQDTDLATYSLTSFNIDGFSVGPTYTSAPNINAATYASWTFRKQPKFFDVVTYTGDGTSNRAISHSLKSTPGCIIVKRTDTTSAWYVYHRGVDASNPSLYYMRLDTNDARAGAPGVWDVAPTSTDFTIQPSINVSAGTYVAYLFAHDAGGFGLAGTDNVISCGTWTGTGSNLNVNLGYEPQWLMFKRTDDAGDWVIVDNMRGFTASGADAYLKPNTSNAETNVTGAPALNSTGFGWITGSGATFIYIAIRRGPMKVPTVGTSVFSPVGFNSSATNQTITTSIVTDLCLYNFRNITNGFMWFDRLRGITGTTGSGNKMLSSPSAAAEANDTSINGAGQTTLVAGGTLGGYTQILECFGRAPSFFDEVCYTGDGTNGRSVSHNLAVEPELMIVKTRSGTTAWQVYAQPLGVTTGSGLLLNSSDAAGYNTVNGFYATPTSSVFYLGTGARTNVSSETYANYLFATCAGVSKVGSYTGTGTTLQIDCGFTGGARFVMIKRTDSTGDWYVWDSARGIIAGNDPYLLLNSTAAEVTNTDYIDTYNAGFEISSTAPAAINASAGTFIFLAIA